MLWLDKSRMDDNASAVVAEGLYALTPVATPLGWVRAGSLVPGAEVLTFDGGPVRVASLSTHRLDPRVQPMRGQRSHPNRPTVKGQHLCPRHQ